jgi:hypothetical protein
MPEKDKVDWNESVAKLFTTGVGRIAEVQQKSIDLVAQQHAELVDLWKKAIQKIPGSPGLFLLELQESGFEQCAEIDKAAIDLAVDQSRAFADLIRERTETAAKVSEGVDNFTKKTIERVVAVQKKALDRSAVQARAVVERSSKQFGEGSPVQATAESMQHGVVAILNAQKELLDMAVR